PIRPPVRRGRLVLLSAFLVLLAGITALGIFQALRFPAFPIATNPADETDLAIVKVRPELGTISGDVRPGDRIEAGNGVPGRDSFYMVHLAQAGRPGGPVRLTVERDGARHDIVVTPRAGLNPRWPSAVPLWLSIALSWTVVALLLWSRPGDHQVVRI